MPSSHLYDEDNGDGDHHYSLASPNVNVNDAKVNVNGPSSYNNNNNTSNNGRITRHTNNGGHGNNGDSDMVSSLSTGAPLLTTSDMQSISKTRASLRDEAYIQEVTIIVHTCIITSYIYLLIWYYGNNRLLKNSSNCAFMHSLWYHVCYLVPAHAAAIITITLLHSIVHHVACVNIGLLYSFTVMMAPVDNRAVLVALCLVILDLTCTHALSSLLVMGLTWHGGVSPHSSRVRLINDWVIINAHWHPINNGSVQCMSHHSNVRCMIVCICMHMVVINRFRIFINSMVTISMAYADYGVSIIATTTTNALYVHNEWILLS